MRTLAGIGAATWLTGIVVLVFNAIGDSGTPTITHIDTLGLAMSVSGAILVLGSKD